MKIETWNCCRGSFESKFSAIKAVDWDILALQEVARPDGIEGEDIQFLWSGDNPAQGVGLAVRAPWRISFGPIDGKAPKDTVPFVVEKSNARLHILLVWTKPEPSYPENLWKSLDCYADFLKESDSIVLGDFNSAPRFDSRTRFPHARLVDRLKKEFCLDSAYHAYHGCEMGEEQHPTHYWTWREDRPFHIDYIFVPGRWTSKVEGVTVGDFTSWKTLSDHRPLSIIVGDEVLSSH